MSFPIYDNGAMAGLFLGVLFGFVLEGAGFGSSRKLMAQFHLKDWAVFKVMLTAVIVCAFGLWLAEILAIIGPASVFIPTLFLWATALGGVLIGAGFAIGGYCPGTSAVGLASGRGDAASFILGMMAGTAVFAAGFEPLNALYTAAEGPGGQTLPDLFGVPDWLVILVLGLMAAAAWRLGTRFERSLGGPLSAEEVTGARAGPAGKSGPSIKKEVAA